METLKQEYEPIEEEVNYDDELKYKLFFLGHRLVQVYKKNCGPPNSKSVAVRDPNTLVHIQMLSVKKLRPAKPRTVAPSSPYKPPKGSNTKQLHEIAVLEDQIAELESQVASLKVTLTRKRKELAGLPISSS